MVYGLVILYLIFVKSIASLGRRTTNGIRDTIRKEQKVYPITLDGLIISSTKK